MALNISYATRSSEVPAGVIQWHLCDSAKVTQEMRDYANIVMEVQADGEELAYIEKRFGWTIPTVHRLTLNDKLAISGTFPVELGDHSYQIKWFGDVAKFIVANL